MIVPMRKATIIVLDSRREEELANLKRLGLLHPEIERRHDERTERLQGLRESVQAAILALPTEQIDGGPESSPADGRSSPDVSRAFDLDRAIETASTINEIAARRREHADALERIDSEIRRIASWGDFDPEDLRWLAERGVEVHLYSMSPKDFRRRAPDGTIVFQRGPVAVRFAMIWLHGSHPCGASPEEVALRPGMERFRIPEVSLHALQDRRAQELSGVEEADRRLAESAVHGRSLVRAVEELERRLRDEHVRLGMDTADRIAFITGYVPVDSVDGLRQAASNNGWGTLIREPDPDDAVPTKIRNPAWIRIIRPVFNLLGVVPGYRERDISLFFLLFFVVFVGMIIGDAGYGAILLAAGVMLLARGRGAARDGGVLLLVLSTSTLAWGAITGNWFGYEPLGRIAPLRYLVVPQLYAFDPRSTQAVQTVCFVLAAIHLSIAHLWNFLRELREKPAIKAIAQLGWLCVLLGLFFLIMSLFIGLEFPAFGLYLIGGGMAAVFLFSGQSPEHGFIGGVLNGLKNAFTIVFDGIGAFSDIISYIRLFAVGLATVAIAQAFNEMAASVGTDGVAAVLAVVILLFGHTLNLIMAGLAVVVHGVRLNLLEFSGHLGMEWTGIEYQPFSENNRSAS